MGNLVFSDAETQERLREAQNRTDEVKAEARASVEEANRKLDLSKWKATASAFETYSSCMSSMVQSHEAADQRKLETLRQLEEANKLFTSQLEKTAEMALRGVQSNAGASYFNMIRQLIESSDKGSREIMKLMEGLSDPQHLEELKKKLADLTKQVKELLEALPK